MEWIDIKTLKPAHGQAVLICAGNIVAAAKADIDFYGDDRIFWDSCGFGGYEWEYDFENHEVTHWIPIPAPPSAPANSSPQTCYAP